MANKPPQGIEPEKEWKRVRLANLYCAIQRYIDAGLTTNQSFINWLDEVERLEIDLELSEASE